jgi:hypothetical protein
VDSSNCKKYPSLAVKHAPELAHVSQFIGQVLQPEIPTTFGAFPAGHVLHPAGAVAFGFAVKILFAGHASLGDLVSFSDICESHCDVSEEQTVGKAPSADKKKPVLGSVQKSAAELQVLQFGSHARHSALTTKCVVSVSSGTVVKFPLVHRALLVFPS